jgi:hypothetical protein
MATGLLHRVAPVSDHDPRHRETGMDRGRMIVAVSDHWTPRGLPARREPMLEHVRDLRTLHGTQSTVTAVIYRNDFRLELRIRPGRRADAHPALAAGRAAVDPSSRES